jgi:hypothetical protein
VFPKSYRLCSVDEKNLPSEFFFQIAVSCIKQLTKNILSIHQMNWKINFLMSWYYFIISQSMNREVQFWHASHLFRSFFFFFFDYFDLFLTFLFFFSLELTHRSFTSIHHILGFLSPLIFNNHYSTKEKFSRSFCLVLLLNFTYIFLHRIESFYLSQGVSQTTLNISKFVSL